MKKILSILLAVIMLLPAGAVTASAEKEIEPIGLGTVVEDSMTLQVSQEYTEELTDIQIRIIQDSVRYAINNRLRNISLMEAFIEFDMTQIEYDENGNIIGYPDFSNKAAAVGNVVENFLVDNPEYFYVRTAGFMTYGGVYVKDDNSGKIVTILSDMIILDYPEPFGIYEVDKNGNYTLDNNGYRMLLGIDEKLLSSEIEYVDTETDRIIDEMSAYGVDSEFDSALWLHDYLVNRFTYDLRIYSEDAEISNSANRYLNDVLHSNIAVCSGYVAVYKYVLNKLGIECVSAYNYTDLHEWAIVNINGDWYHVDPTFDDPTFSEDLIHLEADGQLGYVSHEMFLLTDSEIKQYDCHGEYIVTAAKDVSCSSKKYSNAAWHTNVETLVGFVGSDRYYAACTNQGKVTIYKCGEELSNPSAFCTIDTHWTLPDGKSAIDGYFGGMGAYDKYLYINTSNSFLRIDTTDEKPKPVEVYSHPVPTEMLFGSCLVDGVLYYAVGIFSGDEFEGTGESRMVKTLGHHVYFEEYGITYVRSQHVRDGEKATEPEVSVDGYVLEGWYTDEEFTNKWDFDTVLTESIDLYANWQVVSDVTFMSGDETLGTVSINMGATIPPPDYAKYGKVIEGWYLDAGLTQPWDFNMPVISDMTLFVKWQDIELHHDDLFQRQFTARNDAPLITGVINGGILNFNPVVQKTPLYMLAIYEDGVLIASRTNDNGLFALIEEDGVECTDFKKSYTYKLFIWNDNLMPYIAPIESSVLLGIVINGGDITGQSPESGNTYDDNQDSADSENNE